MLVTVTKVKIRVTSPRPTMKRPSIKIICRVQKIQLLPWTLAETPNYFKLVKELDFRASHCTFYDDDGSIRRCFPDSSIELTGEELHNDMFKPYVRAKKYPSPHRWWKRTSYFSSWLC